MAKGKRGKIGHNSAEPLTDDEASALVLHYELRINEAQRALDAILVTAKSARDVVNGHFKRMTADLQFTRKDFEAEVIAKSRMSEAEYLAAERKRQRLHRLAGRAGDQLDLINDVLPDTADDAAMAYANGYRCGHLAGDPTPPKELAPAFHQDWLKGYHDAQAQNIAKLGVAETVLERLAKPTGTLTAAEPEAEGEGDDALEPDVVAAKARKLRKAGWTEPTPAEAEFAEA